MEDYIVKDIPDPYMIKFDWRIMYSIRFYQRQYTGIFLPFNLYVKINEAYKYKEEFEIYFAYYNNGEILYGIEEIQVNNFPVEIKDVMVEQLMKQAITGFYHSLYMVRNNRSDYRHSEYEWQSLIHFCEDL